MGKHKGSFSLLENYLAAAPSAANGSNDPVPIPDSMRASTLLEQIGKERSWTDAEISHDLEVLEKNRLHFVRDLRALSNHSWTVIELLPIVRDLLRAAVDPEWDPRDRYDSIDRLKEKEKRKMKKKDKKKKKYQMVGEPVTPTRIGGGYPVSEGSLLSLANDEALSQDPETIRNTIRNGSIDAGFTSDLRKEPEASSSSPKKSVSFSNEALVLEASTESAKKNNSTSSSGSSDSSSSESSSSDSDKEEAKATQPVFSGRPIKPVSNNRIRVRTSSGQVYECDRFCPHKGVDLSTWGQVLGNTLVCTKHNWSFGLDGPGIGSKGRTVHPCKVNDW